MKAVDNFISKLQSFYPDDEEIKKLISNTIKDTLETTIKKNGDEYFVITGDIPAMWLRDSSAQVKPFLYIVNEDEEIKNMIKGVIKKQVALIQIDPYANAFNQDGSNFGHHDDITAMTPYTFERKFEIDSLCYPIELSYLYYLNTNDSSIFNDEYLKVIKIIVDLFITEQDHEHKSPYRFIRTNPDMLGENNCRARYETLARDGLGNPTKKCGLIFSGFRPSDDACQMGYLVPSNMFAVVILGYMLNIIKGFYPKEKELAKKINKLKNTVNKAIYKHAVVKTKEFGKVFAFEVNGFGNYILMDDANVPSLLASPYLGFIDKENPLYLNTKKMLFSKTNPFYYEGSFINGIGSPHTPENHIWHISMAVEGITSIDLKRKMELLDAFKKTHNNTYMMHEGFDVNDPAKYSREWFSWANSMFIEFIMSLNGLSIKTK